VNVLFIGDIVGHSATRFAAERVRELRLARSIDLVIANAENAAITGARPWGGFGMTPETLDELFSAGVDVLTSGNHGWDGPHSEEVHSHPRVLRPLNVPSDLPGKGFVTFDVNGEPVTVVNLIAGDAFDTPIDPWEAWSSQGFEPTVFIDFHANSAWEKSIFATAVDGSVAAVLGTHSHEATAHLHRLPGGTAYVADVGMTGSLSSPGGFPLDHFATRYVGQDTDGMPPLEEGSGEMFFGAVFLETRGGLTAHIERVT
jgi:2',3'-cyclic-nucleotide 2'-phosphodiesterase